MPQPHDFNPDLDLFFEPSTFLSTEQLWRGWTDQELLPTWFCPEPWKVSECRIELKVGGDYYTRMQGPQGESVDNHGCILEVIPMKRLVMTNVFQKGLRPVQIVEPDFAHVIELDFTASESGTRYRAIVRHQSNEHKLRHEAMGFPQGWDLALRQLEKLFQK